MTAKRFLDLADHSRDEIVDLLALAQRLQDHPEPRALAGKILGLVFFNPSLRTLASFQAGMARLGGTSFVITPGHGTWQLETKLGAVMNGVAAEHVREGIPVLASFCDALGIRAFAEGKNLEVDLAETNFNAMAELVTKPLINMESAMNHPCQSLADWKTLDDLRVAPRSKFVLSWVNHPRALPLAVPAATLHMAAMRGHDVVVLRPEGYADAEGADGQGARRGGASGGHVSETDDRDEALDGAQVLYAKEWGSTKHYGDAEKDAELRSQARRLAGARELVRARAARLPLHALPAGAPQRRGRRRSAGRPAQRRAAGGVQPDGRADGGAAPPAGLSQTLEGLAPPHSSRRKR
jgi:N-acetylornithine carbamoyltransferase